MSLVSSYAVCFLQLGGVRLTSSAIIYNIVKVKVSRWPVDPFDSLSRRPVDLFEKEPLKGNCEVHLHTPSRCQPSSRLTRRPSTRWPFRKRSHQGPPIYTIEMQCNTRRAKGAELDSCCCKQEKPLQRVAWGWCIYNIVESESDPLTRRPVDLFEKEPLKGNSEVHLHTPTKFGEDSSKDLGGDREQTDKQTNAARIIVWWWCTHLCCFLYKQWYLE